MLIKFQPFGEHAILISWPNDINQETSLDIYYFNLEIQKHFSEIIIETVTAYCSLTIFLSTETDKNSFTQKLQGLYQSNTFKAALNPITWKIPVCYDLSFGMDLDKLANQKSLSIEEVIGLHCRPLYTVNFLGFLPGFPYLSSLNPILHTPRLTTPRLSVPKGSIAIGGKQTGIYPVQSPGGWHIIGKTPLSFFNPNKEQPCFLNPLDKVQFYAISLNEFKQSDDD